MRMGLYLPEESWLLLSRQVNRLKQAVCFYLCHDHRSIKQEKPLFCAFSCLTACLNCVSNYHVAGQSSQCYTEHVVTRNQIEIPSARFRLENNGITGKIKSLCFLFFWRYFVLLVFNYFASPTSPPPQFMVFSYFGHMLYSQYISMVTGAKLANCCWILMTDEGHPLGCLVEYLRISFPSSLPDKFSSFFITTKKPSSSLYSCVAKQEQSM